VSGKGSSLNSACRSKIRSMPFLSPLQDVMNVVLQLRHSGTPALGRGQWSTRCA